jgi:hypothetical protein
MFLSYKYWRSTTKFPSEGKQEQESNNITIALTLD